MAEDFYKALKARGFRVNAYRRGMHHKQFDQTIMEVDQTAFLSLDRSEFPMLLATKDGLRSALIAKGCRPFLSNEVLTLYAEALLEVS